MLTDTISDATLQRAVLNALVWEPSVNAAAIGVPDGVCERALFVLDGGGIIRWSYFSPIGVNPGADGILNALENLSKKEARA